MKTCKLILLLLIGLAVNNPIKAQTDSAKKAWEVAELMKNLVSLDSLNTDGYTNATFKTTRLINSQSLETVKAHTLDFRISHHFGNELLGDHYLYGLDLASDIRYAFEYGITNKLTVGFSRSRLDENLEGLIKYRLL